MNDLYLVEHIYPDDVEKSDRAGLIPIRKMVTSKGKTFYRTYWCRPMEIAHFNGTTPAIEYLIKTIDTQNELVSMVESLEKYNTQLASEIYNQMIKNGEQSIQIADKVVSTSNWITNRETNLSALLAGIKHLLNGKGSIDMSDLTKTYDEVSYQYFISGLDIKGTNEEGKQVPLKKLGVIQELIPMGWTDKIKDVGAAIRQNIKDGLKTIRVLYQKLGKPVPPPQEEELDFRRKENAGKLEQLYVNYQGKKVLSEAQKLSTEGVKAGKPGEEIKRIVIDTGSPKTNFKQYIKNSVKDAKKGKTS